MCIRDRYTFVCCAASLVLELLEYCDEYEDSSQGSGHEMEEGEDDGRKEEDMVVEKKRSATQIANS